MARMIINLTQHPATPEQIAQGVVDLPPELRTRLAELLTFDAVPTASVVFQRAQDIAMLAITWLDTQPRLEGYGSGGAALADALLGGAPYLMCALEVALLGHAIEPVYAFSRRESIEQAQPDGSVRKTNVFRHVGFVRMFEDAPTD